MSSPARIVPDDLLQALHRLVGILNDRHASYALIGGLSVAMRGPVRTTRDVDVLLQVPALELPGLLEALIQQGFQLDAAKAIGVWNRDHILNFTYGSVGIDWLKPVLPVFEHVLQRARWEAIGDLPIRVVDAEGLILTKLIAFRARDQEDIRGILAANAGALDLDWVRREWLELVGTDDPKTVFFEQMVREFYVPTEFP